MNRPIAISIAPNVEKNDAILALRLFFSPSVYFKSDGARALERWFCTYFKVGHAISFNSGRSALYAILKCMGVKSGDEVLIQAFTCVVVPNSITALSASPVYVDTTDTLVMDPGDLENKITKKSKVVVVQHTFGIPTDMDAISEIAKKHKLLLIEDSAHSIGGDFNKKKLGSLSDAGFFSFGRDKAFSSVFGGMVITRSEALGKKLKIYQKSLKHPSFLWTMQQLFHPFFFWFVLPIYNNPFGKLLIVMAQNMQFLSLPVSEKEKKGHFYTVQVRTMPNQLAHVALFQLKRVEKFNALRTSFVGKYIEALKTIKFVSSILKKPMPLLRFPLLVKNKIEFTAFLRNKGIYVGNWYSSVIDPKGTDLGTVGYVMGSCPNAERQSREIVNLPCYPTMTEADVETVVLSIKEYEKNK